MKHSLSPSSRSDKESSESTKGKFGQDTAINPDRRNLLPYFPGSTDQDQTHNMGPNIVPQSHLATTSLSSLQGPEIKEVVNLRTPSFRKIQKGNISYHIDDDSLYRVRQIQRNISLATMHWQKHKQSLLSDKQRQHFKNLKILKKTYYLLKSSCDISFGQPVKDYSFCASYKSSEIILPAQIDRNFQDRNKILAVPLQIEPKSDACEEKVEELTKDIKTISDQELQFYARKVAFKKEESQYYKNIGKKIDLA